MVDYSTYALVGDVLAYSTIIPFVFSWLKLKIPSFLLPLRILFIVSFISSYALGLFNDLYGNNLFVAIIYVTLEYLLLSRIYWLEITDSKIKRFIKYYSITLLIFAIVNLFFVQGFFKENSYTRSLVSLTTILFAFIYFWSILNNLKIDNLYRHPMFWINCGILLYAAASFVGFLFSRHLHDTQDYGPFMTFWTFKNIIGIMRNLFFAYAFWLNFKQIRTKTQLS